MGIRKKSQKNLTFTEKAGISIMCMLVKVKKSCWKRLTFIRTGIIVKK